MKFKKTKFDKLFIVEPDKFLDQRGYFLKSFEKEIFKKKNKTYEITEVSHSFNKSKGTLRGLHMQVKSFSQNKIVYCVKGKIFDVVIDLRKDSKTFGKWYSIELSENNKKMLVIPQGFAHGFQTLSKNSEVIYLISGSYSAEHEKGVRWDDPFFSISWPMTPKVINNRDKNWPLFKKII